MNSYHSSDLNTLQVLTVEELVVQEVVDTKSLRRHGIVKDYPVSHCKILVKVLDISEVIKEILTQERGVPSKTCVVKHIRKRTSSTKILAVRKVLMIIEDKVPDRIFDLDNENLDDTFKS